MDGILLHLELLGITNTVRTRSSAWQTCIKSTIES